MALLPSPRPARHLVPRRMPALHVQRRRGSATLHPRASSEPVTTTLHCCAIVTAPPLAPRVADAERGKRWCCDAHTGWRSKHFN